MALVGMTELIHCESRPIKLSFLLNIRASAILSFENLFTFRYFHLLFSRLFQWKKMVETYQSRRTNGVIMWFILPDFSTNKYLSFYSSETQPKIHSSKSFVDVTTAAAHISYQIAMQTLPTRFSGIFGLFVFRCSIQKEFYYIIVIGLECLFDC